MLRTLNSELPSNLSSLKLRKNILKRVSNVRFLGIVEFVVDEHPLWKPHMEVGLLLRKIR